MRSPAAMRLVGRHDAYLAVALSIALIIIFARPMRALLDYARDLELSTGLDLSPALVILTVVFLFHQLRKRHETQAQAVEAAAEARAAGARVRELQQLVAFGEALAQSLDLESISDVVARHLPQIAGVRSHWVIVRIGATWQPLVGAGTFDQWRARELVAAQVVAAELLGSRAERDDSGDACFGLIAGGSPVGVLGVSIAGSPLAAGDERALGAVAALLAVSLRNAQLFREIRETSMRDALTGCYNRGHALEVIDAELRRARRSHAPLSVVMFDLDHFKGVNDEHGHLCGDAVLAAVGERLQQVMRGSDLKCRYGGEEFLLLLPETPVHGARRAAETLRRELAAHPVVWKDRPVAVSASFGIAAAHPGETSAETLIARADAALYRAKAEGRDCIRIAAEPLTA